MGEFFLVDQDAVSIGVLVLLLAAFIAFFLLRVWGRRDGARKPGRSGRFNLLATKAGGRAAAERLIAGERRKGATSRAEAIERSIGKLDQDRWSWRL